MINQCTATAAAAAAAGSGRVYDLLIVGGGLSGLVVATGVHHGDAGGVPVPPASSSVSPLPTSSHNSNSNSNSNSSSWTLLEARPVLGGRLANDDHGQAIDLGGAWVWPQHQPNVRRLLAGLDGVSTFVQPDDPSSTRIEGGAVELVRALSESLPPGNVELNAPVTRCSLVDVPGTDETVVQVLTGAAAGGGGSGVVLTARRVVIAVPPRLISKHIQFDPSLSPERRQAMEGSHTWMAGVTKVSLVYPSRFWNEDVSNVGLRLGPAFQAYDASTKDGTVAAITFFALVSPSDSATATDDRALAGQVAGQMASVWVNLGEKEMAEQVMSYTAVHVKRWPLEGYISEDPKPTRIHPHPHPVGALSKSEWGGRLMFAGSESDQQSPGVMEGAIGAAQRVLKEIQL